MPAPWRMPHLQWMQGIHMRRLDSHQLAGLAIITGLLIAMIAVGPGWYGSALVAGFIAVLVAGTIGPEGKGKPGGDFYHYGGSDGGCDGGD